MFRSWCGFVDSRSDDCFTDYQIVGMFCMRITQTDHTRPHERTRPTYNASVPVGQGTQGNRTNPKLAYNHNGPPKAKATNAAPSHTASAPTEGSERAASSSCISTRHFWL